MDEYEAFCKAFKRSVHEHQDQGNLDLGELTACNRLKLFPILYVVCWQQPQWMLRSTLYGVPQFIETISAHSAPHDMSLLPQPHANQLLILRTGMEAQIIRLFRDCQNTILAGCVCPSLIHVRTRLPSLTCVVCRQHRPRVCSGDVLLLGQAPGK